MNHILDQFVVILDANVLFPFRKRDLLLSFSQAGLYRARWTEKILNEWTSSLLEKKPDAKDSIFSQKREICTRFPEAIVPGYEPLIPSLNLPDPDDRHVLAAAIRCSAQHIVTDNLKDFPAEYLEGFDIEAISADEFLSRTFDLYQSIALDVLRGIMKRYDNPSFLPSGFVDDLTAKGLPKLAGRIHRVREAL